MSKPLLAYWDIRGFAEPIRLLLEHGGIEYDQKLYVQGDGPDFSRADWMDVKFSLGLDFPNLPYYIEGDFKITESWAIYRYVANKIGLVLTDPKEQALADMAQGNVDAFRSKFLMLCYRPGEAGFEAARATYLESLPSSLESFSAFLGKKKWLAGNNLSFVDFAFAEILDHCRLMNPNCYDKYSNIQSYLDRFFSMEKIASYRSSSRFQKFPINNKVAKWGGNKQ
jgi:glutathione S-transferase